jgi:hypothetical protein
MDAATVGLIGVVVGAGISTGVTYLLAVRKEATDTRNWRRDHALEAYSEFIRLVNAIIAEAGNAYITEYGTVESVKHRDKLLEKLTELYRSDDLDRFGQARRRRSCVSRPQRRSRAIRGRSRDVRQGARTAGEPARWPPAPGQRLERSGAATRASWATIAPETSRPRAVAHPPPSQGDHRWRKPPARRRPR